MSIFNSGNPRAAAAFGAAALAGWAAAAKAAAANVGPSVKLPGVNPFGGWGSRPVNEELARALISPEAYFGRVAYDAGPALTRFSSYPATDLTPEKIAGAQQEAVAGYPLRWSEMIEQVLSRDSHLSGIAQQRVDDVIKGTWRMLRATNDDMATAVRNFCEEALRDVAELDDGFAWLLWANAYCYNAIEITWKQTRMTFPGPNGEVLGPIDVIVPARVDPVHSKHFRFDLRTDEPLLWIGSDQVPLPFGKFVFMKGEGQMPITERHGFMWPCIWLSMFRSIGWAGWATFVERYGLPTPLVQYDGGVEQYYEHQNVYRLILKHLGEGHGAIVPSQGMSIKPMEQPAGGRANDPHSALSDACDAAQSIRVLGATMTTKIGNVGSFAASSNHMEVKYAREEADARRLWNTLRAQLLAPMVLFNCRQIAAVLAEKYPNVSPDMLLRRVPRGMHRVPREMSPTERMQVMCSGANDLGMKLSAEAAYDEFCFTAPKDDSDCLPGKPVPLSQGGVLTSGVKAAHNTVYAPQPEQGGGGKDPGGGGGSSPKGSAAAASLHSQELVDAVEILTADEDGEAARTFDGPRLYDHTTQPRDSKGRFAQVAGAKAAVATHIAKHLTENGHQAEAKGSSVYLKNGSKIEIGNKGDRSYTGSHAAKVQAAVEQHLAGHGEKSVRDWASKTTPAPPPARAPRNVDPAKAAARQAARAEKMKARETARAEKVKLREGKQAERAAVKAERAKGRAERKAATEATLQAKVEAVRAIGAPVTKTGRVDATKVPGATSSFTPPTSTDPDHSFKGRSYFARNAEEMKSEFLGGVGRGGRNEDILNAQIGGTTKHAGGVRDPAQWDAIREKYEARDVETFDDAFQVLAKAAAAKSPNKKPDWRDFDLETLKECSGLEGLELPAWLHEAAGAQQEREAMAAYYGDGTAEDHGGEGDYGHHAAYHPTDSSADVPF